MKQETRQNLPGDIKLAKDDLLQDDPATTELPIDTNAEIETKKDFTAAGHLKFLHTEILQMTDGDLIKSFFSQFHADDLRELQNQIRKWMIRMGPVSKVADLLHQTVLPKEIQTKGIAPHKPEEIQTQLVDFCKNFLKTIENKFSARKLLGFTEEEKLDDKKIKERMAEIYKAQSTYGRRQPQDFVRYLTDNACQQLYQELTKAKQETEKTPPEPWLDLKKEQAHVSLMASLEKMSHGEQIAWLGLILDTEFTPAEVENIHIRFVESEDASQIANYPIKRPVVECANQETVILMAKKVGFSEPEKVGGFCKKLNKKGFEGIDLIITTKNSDTTKHEIRHSIEPKERHGFELILREIFAYAEEYVKSGSWEELEKAIVGELYFNLYKTNPDHVAPHIREQFKIDERKSFERMVHQAVEQLKKRTAEIGELPALRELLVTPSLRQYWDEEFREKKARLDKLTVR